MIRTESERCCLQHGMSMVRVSTRRAEDPGFDGFQCKLVLHKHFKVAYTSGRQC